MMGDKTSDRTEVVTHAKSTRPLRIAVLNRIFKPTGGGAERYSMALVEQLAQRHEIHVFAQQIDHHWPGVTYHRIFTPFLRPRWINQLWFAFATWLSTRKGFDVVHSHENTWHGQVQTVHVVPVKYSLFHGVVGWPLAQRWLKVITSPRLLAYLGLERSRYRMTKHRRIVVTSGSLQTVMAQTYPLTQSVMSIVTPGVSSVSGPQSVDERRAARLRLGLPDEGRGILLVANDYRKKGLPALIAAMRHVPEDCYLAVVGNSDQITGFRQEFVESQFEHRIHFLGSLSNVDDAYRAADCLVHPTLEDTFAMVVLEAMAHGVPVVVSGDQFCGISALLTDANNALILENPRDAHALAEAVIRILSDKKLALRLIANGQAFAQWHLWSEIARQQEGIYYAL